MEDGEGMHLHLHLLHRHHHQHLPAHKAWEENEVLHPPHQEGLLQETVRWPSQDAALVLETTDGGNAALARKEEEVFHLQHQIWAHLS